MKLSSRFKEFQQHTMSFLRKQFSYIVHFSPLLNFVFNHLKINWLSRFLNFLALSLSFSLFISVSVSLSLRNSSHHLFINATSGLIHYSAPVSELNSSVIRLSPECAFHKLIKKLLKPDDLLR